MSWEEREGADRLESRGVPTHQKAFLNAPCTRFAEDTTLSRVLHGQIAHGALDSAFLENEHAPQDRTPFAVQVHTFMNIQHRVPNASAAFSHGLFARIGRHVELPLPN